MAANHKPPPPDADVCREPERLDSWKEIAGYLRRDVRTVRRWEKNEKLPVRRHVHRQRGSVYAYKAELDEWLGTREAMAAGGPNSSPPARRPGTILAFVLAAVAFLSLAYLAGRRFWGTGLAGDLKRSAVAEARSRKVPAPDPEAHELYLRGRYHLNRRTGGRDKARAYFEQAIARDANYAAAYAGLADTYVRLATFGPSNAQHNWALADSAAKRALQLDSALSDAHVSLGLVRLMRDWDWQGARSELLRAIELSPGNEHAHSSYAFYLRLSGRMTEAVEERRRALELDPVRVDLVTQLASEYLFARKYDEAVAEFHKALELEPMYTLAVGWLADAYAQKGLYREAAAEQLKLLRLRGNTGLAVTFDRAQKTKGYAAAARLLDETELRRLRAHPDRNTWNIACALARLGNKEKALQWLQKCYQQRDPGLLQARVDPDMDTLRSDPRFQSLLSRMNLPQ